MYNMYIWTRW